MFWGTWPEVPSSSSSFPSTRSSGNTAALNSLRVERAEPSIRSSQLARHWSHRETSWPSRDTRAPHCDATGSGAPDTVPHPVPPTSPGSAVPSPLLGFSPPPCKAALPRGLPAFYHLCRCSQGAIETYLHAQQGGQVFVFQSSVDAHGIHL